MEERRIQRGGKPFESSSNSLDNGGDYFIAIVKHPDSSSLDRAAQSSLGRSRPVAGGNTTQTLLAKYNRGAGDSRSVRNPSHRSQNSVNAPFHSADQLNNTSKKTFSFFKNPDLESGGSKRQK